MIKVLREYEENGYQITEYTKDGETVSHTVKVAISDEPTEPVSTMELPTIEEQILSETQYQTVLLELSALGGNE